jgi:hypothetical protein
MEGESIVKIYCECKATNYVFLGNQEDVTGPEYYFFECWSCHKHGLLAEEWAIRDILMLDKNKNIMEEAPSYSSEGHRFPDVDDWVEPFLDKPCANGDGDPSTVRAVLLDGLGGVMCQVTERRKYWLSEFLRRANNERWGFGSLYETLEKALSGEPTVLQGDEEDRKFSILRHVEDVMTRLLDLEGCP